MSTPSPESEPPETSLGEVGVREMSAIAKLGLAVYLVAAAGLVLNGDLLGDRFESWSESLTGTRDFRDLASSTGELLCWAPLLACVPLLYWLQARFGGAEWGPWGLRLVDMFSGQRGSFLPWQLVETIQEVPGGLRAVPTPGAGLLFRLAGPCLIVPPGEEREQLLEATAPFVGQRFEPEVFGVGPSRGEWLAVGGVVAIYLPLVVFVCIEVTTSGWGEASDALMMGANLTGTILFIALAFAALLARSTRVELYESEGRPPLLRVDRAPVPFSEIESVARRGGAFWFKRKGGSGRTARIHDPEQADRLAAALERLGLEVSDALPWRARPGIKIPLLWSLALAALSFGFLPAIWAHLVPARRAARLTDQLGHDLLLVWEESSHRPLLVLALPAGAGLEVRGLRGAYGLPNDERRWGEEEGLLIDLETMVWTDRLSGASGTLARVGSATVAPSTSHSRVASDSIEAEALAPLEAHFRDAGLALSLWNTMTRIGFRAGQGRTGKASRGNPGLAAAYAKLLGQREGPLGDFLAGRSSRRVYDLRRITPDKDLVAAVAWGRVLWAVLIPRDSSQTLSGSGITYEIGKGGNLLQLTPGLWRAHLGGGLTRVRAAPPTLADLQRAEARLAVSEPTDEELLDELLAAPGQAGSD